EGDLAKRFAEIGRILLIATTVPEPRSGIRRVPERTVKRGGVLRRIREDRRLLEPLPVERGPDSRHLPIHHRTRSDDVHAGTRMAHGGLREELDGCVVVNAPASNHPAMPVIGVPAEADVRHEDDVGIDLLDVADRGLDDSVLVVRSLSKRVLLCRDTEQEDGGNVQPEEFLGLGRNFVHRQATNSRHGRNAGSRSPIFADEERLYEPGWLDGRLANKSPEGRAPPKASWSVSGTRGWTHGIG